MAGKASLGRRDFAALFSEAAWQAFWTYIFPPLATFATVGAGIVEHSPIMWVIMAGSLTFAGTSLGILSFDRWLFVRSAEHKIMFQRCSVSRDAKPANIVIGIVLKNGAQFPIEVKLTKMAVSCASRIPDKPVAMPRILRVDANSDFFFNSGLIGLEGVTTDPLNALIDAEFSYGRPNGREYTLHYINKLIIPADTTKPFVTGRVNSVDGQIGVVS